MLLSSLINPSKDLIVTMTSRLSRLSLIVMLIMVNQVYAQDLTLDPSLVKSIYFGGGSYYIDNGQYLELKNFIESFSNIENYTITVHSHTDDIGSPEYNQRLSELRSSMTVRKLVELAVPEHIISINDFGEFNPVFDNTTWEGRIRNRRVDIILWPLNTL